MFAATSFWRRPWRELIKPICLFSRPKTLGSAMRRIKYNLRYFRANYTVVVHFTLFLTVLLHRLAVFFFALFMLVLFIFYFFDEDDPLQFEVWYHSIDGQLVFELLLTLPALALIYAGLWLNVLASFSVTFGLLGLHAIFRGLIFEDLNLSLLLLLLQPNH